MGEWKDHVLSDVIDKFIDYRGKTPAKTLAGIPLVTAKIVKDGKILEPNEFISPSDYDSWMTRGLPEIDDVVLTTEAPLGEVALLKNKDVALAQRIITLRGKKDLCHNPFLKYYLQSDAGQYSLHARSSGSTVEGIKASELKQLEVRLPSFPEQKAIAEVLSSLEDKIDLLHRQNKTLESLAQTLFRQWFIEEADPSWDEINLFDIADHIKDGVNPAKEPTKIFRHYSLPAFDEGMEPKLEVGKSILSNKYKVFENSILVSKLNPRTPRVWAIFGAVNEDSSICSTEFQVVKPKNLSHYGFIYYFLKSHQVTNELAGASGGTSGSHQRVNPEDIFNLGLLFPPENKVITFNAICRENLSKIKLNKSQIGKLSALRDSLLPKLMSGDITVGN